MKMSGLWIEFEQHGKVRTGAEFSPDGAYRYTLFREWDDSLPTVTFLMLNPSTADELTNDPTVERCQRRATSWGFGRLEVRNIFALRSTDPAGLRRVGDPVGAKNNAAIVLAVEESKLTVCAWGSHAHLMGRGEAVRDMLLRVGQGPKLHYLRLNKDGTPCHPLYLPYSLQPQPWMA